MDKPGDEPQLGELSGTDPLGGMLLEDKPEAAQHRRDDRDRDIKRVHDPPSGQPAWLVAPDSASCPALVTLGSQAAGEAGGSGEVPGPGRLKPPAASYRQVSGSHTRPGRGQLPEDEPRAAAGR